MNKKSRNSYIELLRIVAMFLIVSFHIASVTPINLSEPKFITPNVQLVQLFSHFGMIGVFIFMLISGYYMSL